MIRRPPDVTGEDVRDQAAAWLVRVQSDAAGADDWLALEAWLAQSEDHRTAFAEIEALDDAVVEMAPQIGPRLAPDAGAKNVVDLTARRPISRRAWIAAAGPPPPGGGGGRGGARGKGPEFTVYETPRGATRVVPLADGSTITLNGGSRVEVALGRLERRVVMADAEAAFSVARDPDRPFIVEAGERQVRVVGTEFNVRRHGADLAVTVRRGVVQVGPLGGEPQARLTAGDQFVHASGRSVVRKVAAEEAFAWQGGRIVARDQRLEDVVADLNRQLPSPVRVEGAARDLRFTGVIVVDDETSVIRRLEAFLPVKATRADGQITLSSR